MFCLVLALFIQRLVSFICWLVTFTVLFVWHLLCLDLLCVSIALSFCCCRLASLSLCLVFCLAFVRLVSPRFLSVLFNFYVVYISFCCVFAVLCFCFVSDWFSFRLDCILGYLVFVVSLLFGFG